jgi:hypothetical protein
MKDYKLATRATVGLGVVACSAMATVGSLLAASSESHIASSMSDCVDRYQMIWI